MPWSVEVGAPLATMSISWRKRFASPARVSFGIWLFWKKRLRPTVSGELSECKAAAPPSRSSGAAIQNVFMVSLCAECVWW